MLTSHISDHVQRGKLHPLLDHPSASAVCCTNRLNRDRINTDQNLWQRLYRESGRSVPITIPPNFNWHAEYFRAYHLETGVWTHEDTVQISAPAGSRVQMSRELVAVWSADRVEVRDIGSADILNWWRGEKLPWVTGRRTAECLHEDVLYVGRSGGIIERLDLQNHKVTTCRGHETDVDALTVACDHTLYSHSADGVIRSWRREDATSIFFAHTQRVSMQLRATGSALVASEGGDIFIWNRTTKEPLGKHRWAGVLPLSEMAEDNDSLTSMVPVVSGDSIVRSIHLGSLTTRRISIPDRTYLNYTSNRCVRVGNTLIHALSLRIFTETENECFLANLRNGLPRHLPVRGIFRPLIYPVQGFDFTGGNRLNVLSQTGPSEYAIATFSIRPSSTPAVQPRGLRVAMVYGQSIRCQKFTNALLKVAFCASIILISWNSRFGTAITACIALPTLYQIGRLFMALVWMPSLLRPYPPE